MGDKRNYAALDWVIGEIGDALTEARQALESYAEDTRDSTRIRFCLTHIHQVLGSLKMVEFHGASLFAEEMELLAQSIINKTVVNEGEALEVLMRSLLQLPIYLEHVKRIQDDHPGIVLPLLNDLRAARKEPYLSETNLFTPDLSSLTNIVGVRHPLLASGPKLKEVIKKLFEMYQYAAASVLRGIKIDENLLYVRKVFARLQNSSSGTAQNNVWHLASALIDSLIEDEIELSVAVKGLLRRLAKEIKALYDDAPASFDKPVDQSLARNLLYYIARSGNVSDAITATKKRYLLDNALFEGAVEGRGFHKNMISAPEPDTIRSVVVALREEMNTVKQILSHVVTEGGATSDLEASLPIVKRVADTLAVLGVADLRQATNIQHDRLLVASENPQINIEDLTDLANELVTIEHRLDAIAKGAGKMDLADVNERSIEIDEAKVVVLQQSRIGLEKLKETIVEFYSSQWDKSALQTADSLIKDVRGGLGMIPLARAASILGVCGEFIQAEFIDSEKTPSAETLTILANAVEGIDYYLDRLIGDFSDDVDGFLDIAEEALQELGCVIPPQITVAESQNIANAGNDAASIESTSEAPVTTVEASKFTDTDAVSSGREVPTLESESHEPDGQQPPQADLAPFNELVYFELDESVDEDIAEIFVEEAREVLETLEESLPQWISDSDSGDAIATTRRAFHTLKGSGRMVKAADISELAWSVENLINRIMDESIDQQPIHLDFVERVFSLLPSLIDAFEKRYIPPSRPQAQIYEAWAGELANGQAPSNFYVEEDATPQIQAESSNALDQAAENAIAQTAKEAERIIQEDAAEERILWELFASEAQTHLAAIDEFIAQMDHVAPIYSSPTDSLQRALHTLKGSAHMAGVSDIAQLAAPLELFIKELRTYQVELDADILQLIRDAAEYTREGLVFVERNEQAVLPKLDQFTARVAELKEVHLGHLIRAKSAPDTFTAHPVDPRMLAIFMAEDIKLLLDADEVIERWQDDLDHTQELPAMMAELKTLELGAEQANFPPMARLSCQLHDLYAATLDYLSPEKGVFEAFKQGHNALLDMIDAVAAAQTLPLVDGHLQQQLDRFLIQPKAVSDDIELTETTDELPNDDSVTHDASIDYEGEITGTTGYSEDDDTLDLSFIQDSVGDVDSSAQSQESGLSITDLANEVSEVGLSLNSEADSSNSDDEVIDQLPADDGSRAESDTNFEMDESDLFDAEEINSFVITPEPDDNSSVNSKEEVTEPASNIDDFNDTDLIETSNDDAQHLSQTESVNDVNSITFTSETKKQLNISDQAPTNALFLGGDPSQIDEDDFDEEIIGIFLEEADELIELLEESIHAWESDPASTEATEEMQRALHTLKGGARLSNLAVMGELTHEYETYLINKVGPNSTPNFFSNIHQFQDLVLNGIQGVKARLAGEEVVPVVPPAVFEKPTENITNTDTHQAQDLIDADQDNSPANEGKFTASEINAPNVPVIVKAAPSVEFSMPESPVPQEPKNIVQEAKNTITPNKKTTSQEAVKISSELLEELVNLAGETSISRGRIEQQVSDFGSAINEIDTTLRRLQEQLRRLDMETEAQIVFRQEQLGESQDFDPLEMDRYSQLQQLSRSLTESASDLVDLKRTLSDKVKDTETILLQQQRINSSLQEGLMRARMVPFSRMVPRLRRIVRQVASELNKQVSFELDNVEGEMDRSVLEHMVAPLEHMLRNAVDHGIEEPAERLSAGKSEGGRILLSFSREGGDILLRLADDGKGIALEKVRQKAIERGLMAVDAELSDHDIMQFILQAGFSTVENVTQISGRGVGMDVVAAEIKQLGGSMTIESKPGVGTQFTVRLPFTVSVNRALMVTLGKESYAIPLNTIEGIVRVSPFELEHYYTQDDARFEYAGESYEVRYLGGMLYDDMQPRLEGHIMPLPVILVRSAQHTMALQVDSLMGSREIVVKSLGTQFSSVQGMSGATVMGDGSVVVIIDPHALVRRAVATIGLDSSKPSQSLELERVTKTVMVVDDSVTVRKVTTRFLEREGFNVITAKDGVDALQVLQTRIPDVMLLDIEMPRMDGFEVAKNMRTTEEWMHIPIVMITSRTGDKHREHALSIGVNHYLGKPYQEELLLQSIHELIGA